MNKKNNIMSDNPELKKTIFFVFYLIFFVVIIILLRSGVNNKTTTKYNTGYNKSYSLKEIKNNNYHFNITLTKNGDVSILDGDKYNEKTEFVKSGNVSSFYYSEGDNYYLRDNNTLIYNSADNPIEYVNFLNANNIEKLLIHGSYISRTEYFSGKEVDYNYEISSTSIIKYLDDMEVDLDDDPNTIVIKTDENNKVYEIDMDLTNYYHYYDNDIYEYKLIISYSKYGDIEDIKVNK